MDNLEILAVVAVLVVFVVIVRSLMKKDKESDANVDVGGTGGGKPNDDGPVSKK